nr:GcpE protein [Salmonella sp. NCTC 7297]
MEPTPQALLESAMRHVDHLDRLNFDQFKVSVKASDVFLAVESYRLLAKQIDQPLHLGITEAGGARSGGGEIRDWVWAYYCRKGSVIRCASLWPPTRWKRSK